MPASSCAEYSGRPSGPGRARAQATMPPVDVPAIEVDELCDPAPGAALDLGQHERRDQATDTAAVDAEDLHYGLGAELEADRLNSSSLPPGLLQRAKRNSGPTRATKHEIGARRSRTCAGPCAPRGERWGRDAPRGDVGEQQAVDRREVAARLHRRPVDGLRRNGGREGGQRRVVAAAAASSLGIRRTLQPPSGYAKAIAIWPRARQAPDGAAESTQDAGHDPVTWASSPVLSFPGRRLPA